MKHIYFFLSFFLIFSTNILIAQGPTFGNTGAITICVNGSYFLNPSTTNGTFSTLSSTIATVNASGYVTGVSRGCTIITLAVTGVGTVTATVTVAENANPSLSITDPLAQTSYKFSNNPQGPIGGLNNYVGYNGYSYSSQARSINTGFFRASNQLGDAAGCPYEYYIYRCTTCGTVPEYATRPQGTFVGNSIQSGSNGQLTYTFTSGVGPFTIVYLPLGGSNITFNSVSNPVVIPLGAFTNSKSYTLISVTDQSTKASTDFSGTIATVSVVPPPTASLTGSPSICPGGTANLTLSLTGTGSITVTLNDGTAVTFNSGTTSGIIPVTPSSDRTYTISSVTDIAGSGTSTGSATVNIYALASITIQPVSPITINEGTTTTLSVTATGQPTISYQWYQDGSAISGANSYSYTTTNTTSAAGTYYVTVSTTCNVVSSTTSTVSVTARPHYIGESFGGGIVFYLTDGGAHGLIAATTDQGVSSWGCQGTTISGAVSKAIGSGAANTAAILAGCVTRPIAASIANDYIFGIYIDWYLPSSDELNLMYINIGKGVIPSSSPNYDIGVFDNRYWSSTGEGGSNAWLQEFSNGFIGNYEVKNITLHVRAIRSF